MEVPLQHSMLPHNHAMHSYCNIVTLQITTGLPLDRSCESPLFLHQHLCHSFRDTYAIYHRGAIQPLARSLCIYLDRLRHLVPTGP